MTDRGDQQGSMSVRRAVQADRDAILALPGLGASTRRLVDADLRDRARRHVAVATGVGAVASDDVVGVAFATRQADAMHVLDVGVAHAHRRRGVATALLAWLAARALDDGVPAVTLEVRAGNAAARALYAGLGFEDAGVRPGYYPDGEDAHVLWHHDPTALAAAVQG